MAAHSLIGKTGGPLGKFEPGTFADPTPYRSTIETLLKQRGLDVSIRELGTVPEGAGHAQRAIDDGCDTVFSCGGDGTAFALLQSLAGSGVALGILPMGTGNVLAQNMQLSRNPIKAAAALLDGVNREVPLGRLTTFAEQIVKGS